MERLEKGVMVMKDGLAWGVKYEDGYTTFYGWIDPILAPIYKSEFIKKPSDVTWSNNPDISAINTGSLFYVERITKVVIIGEK